MTSQIEGAEEHAKEERIFEVAVISIQVVETNETKRLKGTMIGCGNEISIGDVINNILRSRRRELKTEIRFEFVLPRI